jgi:hypothetical protein
MILLWFSGNGLSGFKGTLAYDFALAPGKGLYGFEGTVAFTLDLVPRKARLV